jgi:hypothetical protein
MNRIFFAAATILSGYTLPACLSTTDFMNIMQNWTDVMLAQEDKQHQQRWDFPGSIFFAITIVTTIGKPYPCRFCCCTLLQSWQLEWNNNNACTGIWRSKRTKNAVGWTSINAL